MSALVERHSGDTVPHAGPILWPVQCPASTIQSRPLSHVQQRASFSWFVAKVECGNVARFGTTSVADRSAVSIFHTSDPFPQSVNRSPFLRGNPLMSCREKKSPQLVPRKPRPPLFPPKSPIPPKPGRSPAPPERRARGQSAPSPPRLNRPRSVRFAPTPPNCFVCPGPGRYIRGRLWRSKAARLRLAPPRWRLIHSQREKTPAFRSGGIVFPWVAPRPRPKDVRGASPLRRPRD